MTCIVGVVGSDGSVTLGGDSAGVAGWSMTLRRDAKVFLNGPFVFGFTSSFRMGQLLRYRFTPPEHPAGMETMRFLTTVFIDAVRACLKDGGHAKKTSEQEEGGVFLLGYRGRLFRIDADYQVGETLAGYAACGCGEDVALGALAALAGLRVIPAHASGERVRIALEAAEQWNNGVRGPFTLVRLEPHIEPSVEPSVEPVAKLDGSGAPADLRELAGDAAAMPG